MAHQNICLLFLVDSDTSYSNQCDTERQQFFEQHFHRVDTTVFFNVQ